MVHDTNMTKARRRAYTPPRYYIPGAGRLCTCVIDKTFCFNWLKIFLAPAEYRKGIFLCSPTAYREHQLTNPAHQLLPSARPAGCNYFLTHRPILFPPSSPAPAFNSSMATLKAARPVGEPLPRYRAFCQNQ